jgi:hypothetical protein
MPHIPFFLEHSEWAKPYREEAMQRMDELLAYEHAA